jgi:uncharacterized protein
VVNETPYQNSIVLTGSELISDFKPQSISNLRPEDIETLLGYQPELILLGTGLKHIFPSSELLASVQAQGIGIEVMSTDAACRTFNILVSEDRKVMAILFL